MKLRLCHIVRLCQQRPRGAPAGVLRLGHCRRLQSSFHATPCTQSLVPLPNYRPGRLLQGCGAALGGAKWLPAEQSRSGHPGATQPPASGPPTSPRPLLRTHVPGAPAPRPGQLLPGIQSFALLCFVISGCSPVGTCSLSHPPTRGRSLLESEEDTTDGPVLPSRSS